YEDDAVQAYRALVAAYPSSRLGEKALYSAFEMARESTDRARIGAAAREYLDAFPSSARAAEVKAQTRRRVSVQEAALPSPLPLRRPVPRRGAWGRLRARLLPRPARSACRRGE